VNVTTSIFIQAGKLECEDRAEILRCGDHLLLAVADGAGGIAGGGEAADLTMQLVRESAESLKTASDCRRLLEDIDVRLARNKECGETTAVILAVNATGVFGASVGDSMAWVFSPRGRAELTAGQQRKPFLGCGSAFVVAFSQPAKEGTIILAADGLWKYTSLELIEQRVRATAIEELAADLPNLVRLRSGAFPDDVAVITCRLG
jgi:PPM family protein phosphatase